MNKDINKQECLNKKQENKKHYKKCAIICLVLSFVLLIGGTLSYFTDYATTSAEGTAGTVAISLDTSNINWLNADGQDILNPGDARKSIFKVQNEGNKSVDVRTTIKLTVESEHYDLEFSGDSENQSEFDLYYSKDLLSMIGYGTWPDVYIDPETGEIDENREALPIQTKTVEGNTITYVLDEYSLNGNSDKYDEVETTTAAYDYKQQFNYYLLFDGAAGNEWQDCKITMDIIVEAKQHENTSAGWHIVAQETMTHGSITKDVVPGETVITPIEN